MTVDPVVIHRMVVASMDHREVSAEVFGGVQFQRTAEGVADQGDPFEAVEQEHGRRGTEVDTAVRRPAVHRPAVRGLHRPILTAARGVFVVPVRPLDKLPLYPDISCYSCSVTTGPGDSDRRACPADGTEASKPGSSNERLSHERT